MAQTILKIKNLNKTYDGGFEALKNINLELKQGEILALLGPNGAGKTTLISAVCSLIKVTSGQITVNDLDIVDDYRKVRQLIGLVPQEITRDLFEKVVDTVSFSRGIFGLKADAAYIQKTLESLSLWEKRNEKLGALSGGMKRRVMIAKALAHEPKILFLDEPTAGVDVQLRESMWRQVDELRKSGVSVVLTTHYIEEAERMADRIAVINEGEIIVVDDKASLMGKLGKKSLTIFLKTALQTLPENLNQYDVSLSDDGSSITYTYDIRQKNVTSFFRCLEDCQLIIDDIKTQETSLEEIFVKLVEKK
ncbi:MAG TPA: ABC transporter ATP-binding protein [Oligoflexia bacterium]|nr:ABC transporter ATP-binding protein [Oligoflexia bacterium]HMR24939.1 ABC transporter ATP-binding protein [Oligoflexia bacterium]